LLVSSNIRRFGRFGLGWLALFHRWVGVGLCLLFALWFASGAVLHFVPYPALPRAERLEKSLPIDLSRVGVSPATALAFAPGADGLRLVGIAGRPVYILQSVGRPVVAVSADTGELLGTVSTTEAGHIAAAFQGAGVAEIEGPLAHDQWTVAQEFDAFRPFYRVMIADRSGTALYVSARSGEILQRTTASERLWNWCGANIHWIYFSALRANWVAWDRVVWWLSLAGLLTCVVGLWLGLVRFTAVRRARRRGLTPFRGWLGWHHRLGLFAGAFVFTWILSGWLSMDHGRLFATGEPTLEQVSRMQGMALPSIAAALSISTIQRAGRASEILAGAIADHAFLVARGGGAPPRILWLGAPTSGPDTIIPQLRLIEGVRTAWPNQPVTDRGGVRADDLYPTAEGMPAGTRVIAVGGENRLQVYVDPVSGRIVTVMDPSRRAYAWVYYALHTFKFPGLASHPVLRDLVVLVPLALGFAFSLTGVIVAILRVRTSLSRRN
jgi:hypothetical protein